MLKFLSLMTMNFFSGRGLFLSFFVLFFVLLFVPSRSFFLFSRVFFSTLKGGEMKETPGGATSVSKRDSTIMATTTSHAHITSYAHSKKCLSSLHLRLSFVATLSLSSPPCAFVPSPSPPALFTVAEQPAASFPAVYVHARW